MNVEEFHRRLKELYLPPENAFTLVDVPEIRFAVIDGKGNPQSAAGAEAVKWLYSVVHLIKPLVKKRMGRNFVEPSLECLCWADDPNDFVRGNKDEWKWRVMIAFVDWINQEQFDEAVGKSNGNAARRLRRCDSRICTKERACKSCTSATTAGSPPSATSSTTSIYRRMT